jgi:hypothetical protein
MDIQTEFERFKAFAETDAGFQQVEDGWLAQSNYEKRENGIWFKKSAGDGDLAGFAIDPVTWRFKVGAPGQDHDAAWKRLITELLEEAYDTGNPIYRVLKGRVAILPPWKFPIVCLLATHQLPPKLLERAEEKILELGIGLPYSSICMKRVFRPKPVTNP